MMTRGPKAAPLATPVIDGTPPADLNRPTVPDTRRSTSDLYVAPPASKPIPATTFQAKPPRAAKVVIHPRRSVLPRNPIPRFASPEVQALWRREGR